MLDPIDFGTVSIRVPVWVLIPRSPIDRAKKLIRMTSANNEVGTPIFSHPDLIAKFLRQIPRAAYEHGCCEKWSDLLAFMGLAEKNGITHVVLDSDQGTGMFFSIADVRSAIEKHKGDGGPSSGPPSPQS